MDRKDRKLRVTSELRASEVPTGTRVTPRGREYTMLGLLGGWIAGGLCMYYTWDKGAIALSALKVFGAATGGSLLGSFISWFLPGTRRRMVIIRELQEQFKEERRMHSEADAAVAADIARSKTRKKDSLDRSTNEMKEAESGSYSATERVYISRQSLDETRPVVSPRDAPRRPEGAPGVYQSKQDADDTDEIETLNEDGSPRALLQAIEQYNQGLEMFQRTDGKDDRTRP